MKITPFVNLVFTIAFSRNYLLLLPPALLLLEAVEADESSTCTMQFSKIVLLQRGL